MCENVGQRCGGTGTCVAASGLYGCLYLGNRCMTCAYTLIAGNKVHGLLIYNEHGEFGGLLVKEAAEPFQPFDIITEINNQPLDADEMPDAVASPSSFTVYREGKMMTITV